MKRRGLVLVAALTVTALGAVVAASQAASGQRTEAAQTNKAAAAPARTETATFAGGCFWCVEADFDKVPGVLSTTSGYTDGTVPNPTYNQVAAKTTGHAEVVQVEYDPAVVRYEQLLEYFWRTIDPTTVDRQFCDVGSPYRTAIFAHDEAQLTAARASRAALEKNKTFAQPIVTQIEPATPFYRAEEYHQDYYLKNPIRYKYYRNGCGRDARLKQLWGAQAGLFGG